MKWGLLQPGITGIRTSLTDKTQQAGISGRMLFHRLLEPQNGKGWKGP